MASFPTSVKSFASRSNGQSIDAAHVNDLQDEVNALEDGYLNATARLNSSNSTVANLSVLGNSTIAGTLAVSTGATFSGPVTMSSAVTVNGAMTFGSSGTLALPRPSACRVTSTGAIQVPGATEAGISFDVQRFNQGSIHSTAANSSRITFGSTGLWEVGGCVQWHANLQGGPQLKLVLNDATPIAEVYGPLVASKKQVQSVHALYHVGTTTDYVTLVVQQDSGSTTNIVKAGNTSPEFWAVKVSG